MTTIATLDRFAPIRGTRRRRPTGRRPAGPLRLEESVGLEGAAGPVGEDLRAMLDSSPIVAGAGIADGGPPP
jgi:hypothetical protein